MAKKGLSAAKAKKILTDGYVKGRPLTEKQKKFFGSIADGATPLKKINGGWLDKYNDGGSVQPNYNDSKVSLPPGFKGWGYDNTPSGYNPAWNGPVAQMGGSLPGATGMMYSRNSGTTPEEPKKAQNGKAIDWSKQRKKYPGFMDNFKDEIEYDPEFVDFDSVRRAVRNVESLDGKLMWNPESTATGLYGQRFSEIRNDYPGTRKDFVKDTVAQNEFFKRRFYDGLEASETTPLLQDANDLYNDYSSQIKNFPYSKEDIAVLSNFIGRGGTRKYLGYAIRDSKPLAEALPNIYGPNAKQSNKTPEEYLEKARKYYKNGGPLTKAQDGRAVISQYEEPTFYEKALDRLASPMTTLGYLARGEDIPDNLPINMENRNTFDEVIDMINPAAYIKYGASAKRNLDEDKYLDAGFDALGAIPIIPSFLKRGKGVVKKGLDVENAPLREMFNQPNIYPTNNPLPKNMEPYLSKKVYPFNKEQEIFESFLPIDAQIKNVDLKSIRYDADGNIIPNMKQGGVIEDDEGYRNPENRGKVVSINQPNNDSYIDMTGIEEPLLGVSNTGEQRIMLPGEKHKFGKGTKKVTEYPIAQNGASLQSLDQLTNFTNYNTPQPGGWLDKY